MNHLKWMGHSATIFDIQKELHKNIDTCEVTITAKDSSVRAHRFVLSSCSDMLRNILADVPAGQQATIIVPDIKGCLLDSVLDFIYMGETSLSSNSLSEFLEAINILGIKSAISFECNTVSLAGGGGGGVGATTTTMPLKGLPELEMSQEVLLKGEDLEDHSVTDSQGGSRDLNFIDMYAEPQQHKITYSIEHVPASANEYILTENSGTYTLTTQAKLEGSGSGSQSDTDKMGEIVEDVGDVDDHGDAIIEEYSSGDPIIEISDHSASGSVATAAVASPSVIQLKPKIKQVKLKTMSLTNGQQQAQQPQQQQQQPPPQLIRHNPQQSGPAQTHHLQQSHGQQVVQQQQQQQAQGIVEDPMESAMIDQGEDPIAMLKMENYPTFGERSETGLDLATQAVIEEGMSLQKAAQKYELSKTVLWRRVRKHPNYMKTARSNPTLNLAADRLKRGESLKNISQELDIPMSTLHRYKVRLAQQGRLPEYVLYKKRNAGSKDALRVKLEKAVQACIHEGMSQNHAANLYDIPKSTLWRHLQKRVAEAEEMQHDDEMLEDGEEGDSDGEIIKEELILS